MTCSKWEVIDIYVGIRTSIENKMTDFFSQLPKSPYCKVTCNKKLLAQMLHSSERLSLGVSVQIKRLLGIILQMSGIQIKFPNLECAKINYENEEGVLSHSRMTH